MVSKQKKANTRREAVSSYHRRQYRVPYESTRAFLRFIEEIMGAIPKGRLLDVACGAGANMLHMIKRWPDVEVTGLDRKGCAIEYAKKHFPRAFLHRAHFKQGDLFKIPRYFGARSFDVVTFMQTLLLFDAETYPRVLGALFSVTREWVFISSCFTDFEMDVESRIRLHVPSDEYPSGRVSYNVFAVSRFERICKDLGACELIWRDFVIPIDLAPPPHKGLGTYTVMKSDGERLQFSGCVLMPWKFAAIRVKNET